MTEELLSGKRPRVVIFRSALLPLSETFIRDQAEALRRFEPIYAGLKQVPSGIPSSRPTVVLAAPGDRFEKAKVAAYRLAGLGGSFTSRIRAFAPSLIHAHFAPDGVDALPLVERLRAPLVVTLHGYDVTSSDESFKKNAYGLSYLRKRRHLWDRTHTFLCVSEFIRDCALKAGFPEQKLRVHYTGINCDYFVRPQTPRDGSVLFVGRLVQKKGCAYLLEAMAEVRRVFPAASLTVIGDGPLRDSLEARAKQLDLSVSFLGAQSTSEVKASMARASIFSVPSVAADNGDSEGFGMVFAEAQAMGTPVVSFRHGGIPEVVEDGATGLLVPERDSQALATAIIRLLRDNRMWSQFSVQGATRIPSVYSLQRQTNLLEDIYVSAVDSSRT